MIGETLSHFKITEKLGQGGMGVVYRGIDLNLDRPVAIKVLPSQEQHNEEAVARFLREAKTASKLQHPAITTIYEFGVKDNLRYLVMEFIEGRTLKQTLQNGPLQIRQVLEIGTQLADALSLAGEKGIIHRDIKSENIMLTERGQVKILDFGLAKMVERTGPATPDAFQTVGGVVLGTISYMSLEQALGAELDARTDIYSVGVVFYEMVTGKLPFAGPSPSVILAKILNQPPTPLADLNLQVPPALERIILKCLEKNRDQRYPNAMGLLTELRSVRQEIERSREWSGTVVVQPGQASGLAPEPAARLQELVPPAPSSAAGKSGANVVLPQAASSVAPPVALPKADRGKTLEQAWRTPVCLLVKLFRKGFTAASLLYIFACLALFALPILRAERVGGSEVVSWLHFVVDPAVSFITDLVEFDLTFRNFNLLLLVLALAVYFLQMFVTGRLHWLETQIREPLLAAVAAGSTLPGGPAAGARVASRM